ncbi:hypothetical protein GGC64_000611 [Mycobacterium sp. OAS707]|uniref:hypothetical protein n=1 Tax=Mycobacterium sp. OAS707 TaxID=2663822 RepID=UPI001789DE5C|nr:hypothetical protein [Mycobacterium sp. OAS707]MBE1546603.1 hypothetical protein [Mycobacterium sp. OAS707]
MTYMGKPYYPEWLDNLAEDATLEAAAMDGAAHGAADVRSIVVAAKELYDNQQFNYAGPCGDDGFLEIYTTDIRGVHTRVIVLVNFNDAGQTQQIVVNHRPRSALLAFSRVMLEKFSGTPLARHWQDTP